MRRIVSLLLLMLFSFGCNLPSVLSTPVVDPTKAPARPSQTMPPAAGTPTPLPPSPTSQASFTRVPSQTPSLTASFTPRPPNIEEMQSKCPTAAEITEINSRLKISFEKDPTTGKLVCTKAQGSADLTLAQERAYQAILSMKRIQFSRPLPWTDKSLYEWFVTSVNGIRFRGDISTSYCCDPLRTINIQLQNLSALATQRWIGQGGECALSCLVVLLVHEAYHSGTGKLHTCNQGADDNTLAEMGAWAAQYYLYTWLATYTDPTLMTSTDTKPAFYRETMRDSALLTRKTRFCREPTLTPGALPTLPQPGSVK